MPPVQEQSAVKGLKAKADMKSTTANNDEPTFEYSLCICGCSKPTRPNLCLQVKLCLLFFLKKNKQTKMHFSF